MADDLAVIHAGSSPVTAAAPTNDASVGVLVDGDALFIALKITGGVLAGSGVMRGYLYAPAVGVWIRAKDLDVSITSTGPTEGFLARVVGRRPGLRALWIPDNVGHNGTQLTVYHLPDSPGSRLYTR